MVGSRLNVHLYRDSFNTPWGFRLQGGTDLNQPLVVQRVFSNSPAEGELQRGDVILSINNKDGSQLTHKQAQDSIKHGGGQVDLVVNRPPPGSGVAPLSPPIVTQLPRAPSLQSMSESKSFNDLHEKFVAGLHDEDTPVTKDYVKMRLDRLRTLAKASSANYGRRPKPGEEPEAETVEPDRLASGPIPKVCSRNNLGGRGGQVFGSTFGGGADVVPDGASTLPRRSTSRQSSQPPNMPNAGAGAIGFIPKKITLNKIGGGGPDFGSDFSNTRVQSNLENMTLSPRTPEAPGGAPFYQPAAPAPAYQPAPAPAPAPAMPPQDAYSTPTAMLLDQQRVDDQEQEAALLAKAGHTSAIPTVPKPMGGNSKYADFGTDYRTPQQQKSWKPVAYKQAPPAVAPRPAPPPVAAPAPAPAPAYVAPPAPAPVAVAPPAPVAVAPPAPVQQPAPSWQNPPPQAAVEEDGTPAWKSTLRSSGVKPWERDLANAAQQEAHRSVPFDPVPAQHSPAIQIQSPAPAPFSPPAPQFSPAPVAPAPVAPAPVAEPEPEPVDSECPSVLPLLAFEKEQTQGPKVVHLQYNSPMGLYSEQNVQDTLAGQAAAMMEQSKPNTPNNPEGRDWSQSAVLQFIEAENQRNFTTPVFAELPPEPAYKGWKKPDTVWGWRPTVSDNWEIPKKKAAN